MTQAYDYTTQEVETECPEFKTNLVGITNPPNAKTNKQKTKKIECILDYICNNVLSLKITILNPKIWVFL